MDLSFSYRAYIASNLLERAFNHRIDHNVPYLTYISLERAYADEIGLIPPMQIRTPFATDLQSQNGPQFSITGSFVFWNTAPTYFVKGLQSWNGL